MRIYAAIAHTSMGSYRSSLAATEYPALLMSFLYDPELEGIRRFPYRPRFYMTDSGAFTVWTKGDRVDLQAYVDWMLRLRAGWPDMEYAHLNLDVIPGTQDGPPATSRQRKAAMRGSLANADRIRGAGLPVMEVHHQTEPEEFLWELLDRRQPGEIVGISPRKNVTPQHRISYCAWIFRKVIDRYGLDQLPPLHGLGVAGRQLTWRFPWFSTDTSAWVAPSKYGRIMTRSGRIAHEPRTRKGSMRNLAITRGLAVMRKWEADLTTLWERRGVQWQP